MTPLVLSRAPTQSHPMSSMCIHPSHLHHHQSSMLCIFCLNIISSFSMCKGFAILFLCFRFPLFVLGFLIWHEWRRADHRSLDPWSLHSSGGHRHRPFSVGSRETSWYSNHVVAGATSAQHCFCGRATGAWGSSTYVFVPVRYEMPTFQRIHRPEKATNIYETYLKPKCDKCASVRWSKCLGI